MLNAVNSLSNKREGIFKKYLIILMPCRLFTCTVVINELCCHAQITF